MKERKKKKLTNGPDNARSVVWACFCRRSRLMLVDHCCCRCGVTLSDDGNHSTVKQNKFFFKSVQSPKLYHVTLFIFFFKLF